LTGFLGSFTNPVRKNAESRKTSAPKHLTMNRIQQMEQLSKSATANRSDAQSRLSDLQPQQSPCSFFAPLHYEKNYEYPLFVWLHDQGHNEKQLATVMPLISMRNYVAVAPRGQQLPANAVQKIEDSSELPPLRQRFTWNQTASGIGHGEEAVWHAVDNAREKFNIESSRIFLAGFGAGGTMALRIGMLYPNSFAGALSIGGCFPSGHAPLARIDEVRQLPIFIANGRESTEYPVERTCEELRLFHSAGMAVTLRQYPCGDELTTQMLHDMDVWIMEHVTGVDCSAESQAFGPNERN
jgi:phospholipase/carboxylesterase